MVMEFPGQAQERESAKSFVFLDIETTGLPHQNFGRSNITELAMHTFSTNDFTALQRGKRIRLLGKLTMCFNPGMRIDPVASELSGLYNDMLENLNKFDENSANAIISYLNHFPQPVCLVAHNGKRFDFPIIKKSFEKLGLKLPDSILCADSLDIIKKIDKIEEEKFSKFLEEEYNEVRRAEADAAYLKEEIDSIEKLVQADLLSSEMLPPIEDIAKDRKTVIELDDIINELLDPTNAKILQRQKFNESTPRRNTTEKSVQPPSKKTNGIAPNTVAMRTSKTDTKARKELFPGKAAGGKVTKPHKKFKSYKLSDIYERIFKENPEVLHAAEADVVTLHRIAFHYNEDFAQVAHSEAIPFAQIKTNGFK